MTKRYRRNLLVIVLAILIITSLGWKRLLSGHRLLNTQSELNQGQQFDASLTDESSGGRVESDDLAVSWLESEFQLEPESDFFDEEGAVFLEDGLLLDFGDVSLITGGVGGVSNSAATSTDTQTLSQPETDDQKNVYADKLTLNYSVPFSSQAPLGRWEDSRQQDGCEEAAALMAMAWVRGEGGLNALEWEQQILALADWQQEKYGEHRDVSLPDMRERIFKDYFSYEAVRILAITGWADILTELEKGSLVLMPTDGRVLKNPHYKAPGPEHHMLLIKGYDYTKGQFITNDPGTRFGADYRYDQEVIFAAVRAYPTGYKGSYNSLVREILVVDKL